MSAEHFLLKNSFDKTLPNSNKEVETYFYIDISNKVVS